MSLHDLVRITPYPWLGKQLEADPGNVDLFVPSGLGLAAPPVMMPWDNLEAVLNRPNYYGFTQFTGHPVKDAPLNDSAGGTVYFDGVVERPEFEALMRLLHVGSEVYDYGAFLVDSAEPLADRYLTTLRIVRRGALQYLYNALSEEEAQTWQPQPLSECELLWKFIEHEREKYGTSYGHDLEGTFGGDGDWARETLAFGFIMENAYHGVFRIWSRAWLVTK